jgi:hypothetical protein
MDHARALDTGALMSRVSKCARHESSGGHWYRPAASSVELEGLGDRFDDLPQLAVRPVVPDTTVPVGALLLKHAKSDELIEFRSNIALRDYFTWRLRLKEARLVMARDPQSQLQSGWAPEEQLSNLMHVHWRVPVTSHYLLSRI